MKKVLVIGAFGCGNKGDDAILEGLNNVIGERCKLIPTQGKYGKLSTFMGEELQTLSCRMNEGFSLAVMLNLCSFFIQYMKELKGAQIVVIGGGSLLHDLTKYNLPFFYLVQTIAKSKKVPVYYVGVGAGPIKTTKGKCLLKKMMDACEGSIIRDPVDYQLLQDIGVSNTKLSVDTAFAGKINFDNEEYVLNDNNLKKNDYVVVTACQWFESSDFWNKDNIDFEEKVDKLARAIERLLVTSEKKVVFLPTVHHDYKLGLQLKERINSEMFIVLSHEYDCREMSCVVANSCFIFGMRMHSLIFAIRSGVPFLATIYDGKVLHLIERLDMKECIIDFKDIDTSILDENVKRIIQKRSEYKEYLDKKSIEFRKMTIDNINGTLKELVK